jgi:amino acid adenylation domain-containing protein/non-ribosomal peptide synthase protein (TIGR01720 family)
VNSKIEDIYPLTPMQEGMLFHSQYAPESGMYVEQLSCRFMSRLNVSAFEKSWQHVIDRHGALSSSFVWDGLKEPVQVVQRGIKVPIELLDWRHRPRATREAQIRERLERERRKGFKLDHAPLMRLSLFRLEDDEYEFVWLHHHLLIDGWSLSIVLKEVFDCYLAFESGQEPKLPLPGDYRNYVQWRKRQDLKKAESFWKRRLQGFRAATAISMELRVPGSIEMETSLFASESFCELSEHETNALQTWARENQLTLNTVVQGAWAILLSRYSGGDDVVFGTTVAGRPADVPGIDKLVGLFINTLPVRVRFVEEKPVLSWLLAIQDEQAEARAYEYASLAAVQGWGEAGHGRPLFDTIVVFENYPVSHSLQQMKTDAVLKVSDIRRGEQTNYGIVLAVTLETNRLKLQIAYDSSRYHCATINRGLKEVANLLKRLPESVGSPLGSLRLLEENTREQLVREWNNTSIEYPEEKFAHDLFEHQARRTPAAVALELDGTKLSYAELNHKANQLTDYLRQLGIGRGSLVALLSDRSFEMVVALIGILKAGGAYVPLDATYPPDRLAVMLEDARPAVILTQEKLLARLPQYQAAVICLDRDWPAIVTRSVETPRVNLSAQDLAYVIYTSGSTGKPKGAMNTHGGLRNHLLWRQSIFPLGPSDTVLQKISISFDPSVWEIWGPLIAGARLVLANGPTDDPQYIVRELLKHDVTIFQSPPPVVQTMLEVPEFSQCSSLKNVICGAEALTLQFQEHFFNTVGAGLHNLYGPTETAVDATYWKCRRGAKEAIVPIGRPVRNVQVYVLGAGMEPAPPGTAGELYIGGGGLAQGYLNRPELTTQQFVANPFSECGGERLYKTGDFARWGEDGVLEFLGRLDHQVKVRGFRIELGEIEAVLARHEDVDRAVVVADRDRSGSNRLIAYVVMKEPTGAVAELSALRRYLKTELPSYMVPGVIMPLKTLPLTVNGKIDREKLPKPEANSLDTPLVAPRTPTEEMLAGIWNEILAPERIGIHDNFFESGGHSLLATQMASRIRRTWGTELPLKQLFAEPTIAGIATIIEESQRRDQGRQMPPILPVSREASLPLSFAQQRLWFLEQLQPGDPIAVTVWLEGMLDVGALQQAVDALVRRHEVLRTIFPTVAGRAAQVIQSPDALPLRQADLEELPAETQSERLKQLLSENERAPFDLNQGPLLRGLLVRLNARHHVLQFAMHHIVSDGWSMGVLARELGILYAACRKGQEHALPDLKVQYAEYAVWQREWMQGDVLQDQLRYWEQQLAGISPLELPADRVRRDSAPGATGLVMREVSVELSRSLKKVAQEENVTLFMLLLAIWQVLLWRYTRQQDIAVGTPVANRNREDIEGLIGFFVNTLVMRHRVEPGETVRQLLQGVKRTALEAYAHQDVPFERLVEELQPEREATQTPLVQVMLALQNAPLPQIQLDGLKVSAVESAGRAAHHDLTLEVQEREGGGLNLGLHYRQDRYEIATAERMVGHFQELLAAAARGTEQRVAVLPMLTREEEHLLQDWNGSQLQSPQHRCVHELFEEQAKIRDAVALVYEDKELSYRELNLRANRLAHYLRELGVGPESRVAVCVERGLEMVVGMLAILKAGGAYVPLDPSYPRERLQFILQDSACRVMLAGREAHGLFNGISSSLVVVDLGNPAAWSDQPDANLDRAETLVDPECLAYIIYTSGSTGEPKGSEIPHRSIPGFFLAADYARFDEQAVWLQHSSVNWDALTLELWPALLTGGRCVLARQRVVTAADLKQYVHQAGVNSLWLAATLFNSIVESDVGALEGIRDLLTGGEAASVKHIRQALEHLPKMRIVNGYGPSECTVFCSCYAVPSDVAEDMVSLPIGKPIGDRRVYVLDECMNPAPVGVAGEAYIAGPSVPHGYMHRPDLTAQQFVPDPFSRGGERLYRTGDLVRWNQNGLLEFLGREDAQVKIRGFRIELGEIEAALAQSWAVRECAVIAREDTAGNKRLVVYYTVKEGVAVGAGELRAHLAERLPEYMVPAAYVQVEKMPLTPNGKLNRKDLPVPDGDAYIRQEYEAPVGEIETVLAGIWAELLQVDRVGVHDNFFELGGDSILSIQAVARANQAGFPLTARQMLEAQTIAELARVVHHARAIDAEQGAVTGTVALTPIQRWFFEHDWPRKNHFNQAVLLEPLEELEPALVKKVVEELLQQHDALRMRFRKEEGGWRQENLDQEDAARIVQWVDLTHVGSESRSIAITEEAEKWQRSLDLENGPLVQVVVMQLRGCQRLLVIIHHLVVDGVSWRILLGDFEKAYRQLLSGKNVQLGHKTTSFKQWADRLHEYSRSAAVQEEIGYWQAVLEQPEPSFPPDARYAVGPTASLSVALDPNATRALATEVPAASQTSVLEALLTAVGRTLSLGGGGSPILLDLEGHGREHVIASVDISRTVGWFTTVFPVRLNFDGNNDRARDLRHVKEQLRRIPNHGIGFGLLRHLGSSELVGRLKELGAPRVCFNYLGQLDQALAPSRNFALAEESPGILVDPGSDNGYTMVITAEIKTGKLHIHWAYRPDLHSAKIIQKLAQEALEQLRSLISLCQSDHPGTYLPSDFPLARLQQDDLDSLLADLK